MLSIDEAIAHAREKADKNSGCWKRCTSIKDCKTCEQEHEQLAEWLEELKAIKEKGRYVQGNKAGQKIGYRNAIDDFVKEICKMIVQSENNGNYRFYAVEIKQAIVEIAEQLKEQK